MVVRECAACLLTSRHLKPIWRIIKIDKAWVRNNRIKHLLNPVLLTWNREQSVAIGALSLEKSTMQCFAQLAERSLVTICGCGMEFYWNSAACLATLKFYAHANCT
jgi:hypothetical protein